jgi:hypothetical protein
VNGNGLVEKEITHEYVDYRRVDYETKGNQYVLEVVEEEFYPSDGYPKSRSRQAVIYVCLLLVIVFVVALLAAL